MSRSRTFEADGQSWVVTTLGTGFGVGTGGPPSISRWMVDFHPSSDPEQLMEGTVFARELNDLSDEHLTNALRVARLRHAIESSSHIWRTVGGLAKETDLPGELIRSVILAHPDVFQRSTTARADGRELFTTRRKYREELGFFRRYLDTLGSGSAG